jgi:YHS domain-containing protein
LTLPFTLAYDGNRKNHRFEFSSRIMRFLIWLVVLCWTVAMLRRIVVWMLRGFMKTLTGQPNMPAAPQQSALSSGQLVRDPVCGVHVTEDRAFSLEVGGQTVHFCSVACRDQYAAGNRKFAANG